MNSIFRQEGQPVCRYPDRLKTTQKTARTPAGTSIAHTHSSSPANPFVKRRRGFYRYKLFFVLPAGAQGQPLTGQFSGVIRRVVANRRTPYLAWHVRNIVMTPPGTTPVAELVEEFWLDSLEDGGKLLELFRQSRRRHPQKEGKAAGRGEETPFLSMESTKTDH